MGEELPVEISGKSECERGGGGVGSVALCLSGLHTGSWGAEKQAAAA